MLTNRVRRIAKVIIFMSAALIAISTLTACKDHSTSPQPPPEVQQPDLTFTGRYDFKFERTLPPTGNDLYTILVEVRNAGSVPVKSVQVTAYSQGPGIKGDQLPLDNNGYYSIDPGQTIQARFQFLFEKQFSGEYQFTITIDSNNEVFESNENNNRLEFKRVF